MKQYFCLWFPLFSHRASLNWAASILTAEPSWRGRRSLYDWQTNSEQLEWDAGSEVSLPWWGWEQRRVGGCANKMLPYLSSRMEKINCLQRHYSTRWININDNITGLEDNIAGKIKSIYVFENILYIKYIIFAVSFTLFYVWKQLKTHFLKPFSKGNYNAMITNGH